MPDYSGDEEISVEGLIEAQRKLVHSKNLCERVVGSLCISTILKNQLMGLPNSAISRLMTNQIWSQLNLLGPESVIVNLPASGSKNQQLRLFRRQPASRSARHP